MGVGVTMKAYTSDQLRNVVLMGHSGAGKTMLGEAATIVQGKPARVKVRQAKKIEGNPDHPLNRGKLCARGQAGLNVLYNPDRLRGLCRRKLCVQMK